MEKILFAAERKYYSDKVDECQNQSKSLWRIINEITHRKSRTKTEPNKLKRENKTFAENPKEIADMLNDYFINVGPN